MHVTMMFQDPVDRCKAMLLFLILSNFECLLAKATADHSAALIFELVDLEIFEGRLNNGKKCYSYKNNCNLAIRICIASSESFNTTLKCNVYKSPVYYVYNITKIKSFYYPKLGKRLRILQQTPVRLSYRIEVEIKGYYHFPSKYYLPLARLYADVHLSATSNGTKASDKTSTFSLSRCKDKPYQNNVTSNVIMKLVCGKHYYGNYCETHCIPNYPYHRCDETGQQICLSGYTGKQCRDVDFCEQNPCIPQATCTSGTDKAICSCRARSEHECYKGFDYCSPNPCKNGGECERYSYGYQCKCIGNYHGDLCQMMVNLCKPNPCQNEGKCFFTAHGKRKCFCTDAFEGKNCERPLKVNNISTLPLKANSKSENLHESSLFYYVAVLAIVVGISAILCITFLVVPSVRRSCKHPLSYLFERSLILQSRESSYSCDKNRKLSIYSDITDTNKARYMCMKALSPITSSYDECSTFEGDPLYLPPDMTASSDSICESPAVKNTEQVTPPPLPERNDSIRNYDVSFVMPKIKNIHS